MQWWLAALTVSGALIAAAGLFLWSTRPSRKQGTKTKDSVLYTWQWKQVAILGSGPMLTLILIWQLWTIDPHQWCSVATESGFRVGDRIRKLEVCKEILLELLNLKDHTLIGLLVILGGVIAMLSVSEFKTRLKAGAMGTYLEVGHKDDPPPTSHHEPEPDYSRLGDDEV
jgi:hypothetical protein